MPNRRDLYAVLGVAPDSEDVVIAAAYRALMRRYHPDTNKDETAQQKAREINEAYAVLGHAAKRAEYDRQRAKSRASGQQQQRSSGQGSDSTNGAKPNSSKPTEPAPSQQQPTEVTASSFKEGFKWWLVAAGVVGLLVLPPLLVGANNEVADNTLNVDETMTTNEILAADSYAAAQAADNALDAAGNAVDNAAYTMNAEDVEAPPGLSKLPDAQVEYNNIESAAEKFAAVLMKDGIAGARSFSDRCHKAVVAQPSWSAADYCAAFDFAAAHVDQAISAQGKFPANGYFQFQRDNQDDAYVAAGAYPYTLVTRLMTIRRAVEPAAIEAVNERLAVRRAREDTKPEAKPETTSVWANEISASQ